MIVLLKMIYKNRELSNVVHIYMNLRHVSDWQRGLRSGQSTQTVHPRPKHQCRASAPSFFVPGEVWDPANPKKSHVRLRQLSWITHVTIGSMANISICVYIYIYRCLQISLRASGIRTTRKSFSFAGLVMVGLSKAPEVDRILWWNSSASAQY